MKTLAAIYSYLMLSIRKILRAGSIIFGLSAVLLLLAPALFLEILALNSGDTSLQWSMRMIGITLVAVAGNMWMNTKHQNEAVLRKVAQVMALTATSLGVLTLSIPTELNWFTVLYSMVGFTFGIAYSIALLNKNH